MKKATFFVTKVGPWTTMTHERKDGSGSFETRQAPLTLKPSLDSGLNTDIVYTLWVNDATVIEKARAGVAHPTHRLGLLNEVTDIKFGQPRPSTWTTKDGTEVNDLKVTVWLEQVAPIWEAVLAPVSRNAGNIHEVSFPEVKARPTIVINDDEDPFN